MNRVMALPSRPRAASCKSSTAASIPVVRLPARERPLLVVIAGPELGRMYAIPRGQELLIGRDEQAEIRIEDISVSRRHALLHEHDGEVTLSDLGSRNGTFIEGQRIDGERRLRDGEQIQVGGASTLKFTWVDELDLQYQRHMADAALCDPLTGIHNRRYFEERAAAEVAAVQRHGGALSLLLIDIDWFKRINDEHGHLAGDAVLRMVAKGLEQQLRREDTLARYGGEEFVVIARATAGDGAEQFAERLRRSVEDASLSHDGEELRVTVSIGVAELTVGSTLEQLVEAADAGLYRAKHRGRNRVVTIRY